MLAHKLEICDKKQRRKNVGFLTPSNQNVGLVRMTDSQYSSIIWLTQNKYSIVDNEDYQRISQYKWRYNKNAYALAHPNYRLHRLIMLASHGEYVDHINGDGLDNRKANLRLCTNAENCRNTKLSRNSTSGYKGVARHPNTTKWRAYIVRDNKQIHLGLYENKDDAARAYNAAAIKYHGEFARLNIL